MVKLILLGQLLAQRGGYSDLGSKLHGRRARWETIDIVIWTSVLIAMVLGVWVLARIAARQDRGQRMNNPWALFRSLCKAHGLRPTSRRVLKQLAHWQQLEHPSRLFVEPERFAMVNLSPALQSQTSQVHALRDRIFGDLSAFEAAGSEERSKG